MPVTYRTAPNHTPPPPPAVFVSACLGSGGWEPPPLLHRLLPDACCYVAISIRGTTARSTAFLVNHLPETEPRIVLVGRFPPLHTPFLIVTYAPHTSCRVELLHAMNTTFGSTYHHRTCHRFAWCPRFKTFYHYTCRLHSATMYYIALRF